MAPTLLFDEAQGVLKRRNPDDPTKTILLGSFSKRFANYGVNVQTLRFDGVAAKGYLRAAFADAWNAYLPEGSGNQPVAPLQSLETSTFGDPQPVAGNEGCNGLESAETSAKQGTATAQRVGNRGAGREDAPAPVSMPSQPSGTKTAGEAYRRAKDGE